MQLQQHISLKQYNTFGIDMPAEYFVELTDIEQLSALTEDNSLPQIRHIIGGGSNILLTQPVAGLVILNRLKGYAIEKETEDHTWIRVQAGEVWHDLVMHSINTGLGGIENLALIPGTVGAAPMQNIGAYGVEARETIDSVSAWHWQEKTFITLKNEDCHFGYRDSIFKHELKDKVFITSVVFRLNKKPVLNISYGAIEQELQKMQVSNPTIKDVAHAVITIRSSKLPDPKKIGNAGSFFKNPTIEKEHYERLQALYPTIPSYPIDSDHVKIPAGWLIEQCGWKGKRKGDAGVHEKQALVLVNYGNANGKEIWALSGEILRSVQERYGINLEREVQVI